MIPENRPPCQAPGRIFLRVYRKIKNGPYKKRAAGT
jgi:hypothetical protein